MAELSLWFTQLESGVCELEKTLFKGHPTNLENFAVRGKTAGAYKNAGSFQWTPGVKALAVMFLTAVMRYLKQSKTFLPELEGENGSLASSFDYALSKQPEWLFDMFGADEKGNAYLRQLVLRSNSGRKRSRPVSISLNEGLLSPSSIRIYLGNTLVENSDVIRHLIQIVVSTENQQLIERRKNKLDTNSIEEEFRDKDLKTDPSNLTQEPEILPVSEQDIDRIFEYEEEHFPGHHATKERLLEWLRHDPQNFMCIKEADKPFIAYYLIKFLKPEATKRYLAGTLSEDDIAPNDLIEPSLESYARQEILHATVFASRRHTSMFAVDLLWHLIGRVLDLAVSGCLTMIYAEVETNDGKILVERLGFKCIDHKVTGGLLYELKLDSNTILEWEWRYKLRTFCKIAPGKLELEKFHKPGVTNEAFIPYVEIVDK